MEESEVTRRHRLHGDEVPEVIEGLRLQAHLETRGGGSPMGRGRLPSLLQAHRAQVRATDYPEPVTWDLIESW